MRRQELTTSNQDLTRKRHVVHAGIVLFWIVMSVWFVRFEAFPDFFRHSVSGYRGLFAKGVLSQDNWMKITFKGAHVGHNHTWIETDETDPVEQVKLTSETALDLKILGEIQSVMAVAHASLDALYQLQTFSFRMSSKGYSLYLHARRIRGQTYLVNVSSPAGHVKTETEIPDAVLIYSPMIQMSLKTLKLGQTITMRTLDPISMQMANVRITALRHEPISLPDGPRQATVLAVKYQGMEMLSWIDADGMTLRQTTPFGWTMEAATPETAQANRRTLAEQEDILGAMAVPSSGSIPNPRDIDRLHVRLSGLDLRNDFALESPRQKCLESSASAIRLLCVRAGTTPPFEAGPAPSEKHRAPTLYLQSDAPAIRKRARRIVPDASVPPLEAAYAIHDWVHKNIAKEPTVSLPSALDVLQQRKGDCNEHTYLFVALARAAGLPAKIEVGLLYMNDAFYYHAWPAVFVGYWLEMDPTLGQRAVDATHIRLLEGGFEEQVKLLRVLGTLRIDLPAAQSHDEERS